MLTPVDVQTGLAQFYENLRQQPVQITHVTTLHGGWETDVLAFQLAEESLVVRLYPGQGSDAKANWEYTYIKNLYELGYSVPQVYLYTSSDTSPFKIPFIIMDRIDGRPLGDLIREAPSQQQVQYIHKLCQLHVNLHQLAWQSHFTNRHDSPYSFIDSELAQMQQAVKQYDGLQDFLPVLDWLRTHRDSVPCHRYAATHNDFHPWNILTKDAERFFVIDWPNGRISDPREDIAWTWLLSYAYLGAEAAELYLRLYEQLARQSIEQFDFFRVLAAVRRLGIIMISVSAGAGEMGMRPGAEDIIRQHTDATRAVHNLLHTHTGLTIPSVLSMLEG